jgi:hypothetical protein
MIVYQNYIKKNSKLKINQMRNTIVNSIKVITFAQVLYILHRKQWQKYQQ